MEEAHAMTRALPATLFAVRPRIRPRTMLVAIVLVVSIEIDFEEKTSPTFIGLGGVIPLMGTSCLK
jgi:hypothetical protein